MKTRKTHFSALLIFTAFVGLLFAAPVAALAQDTAKSPSVATIELAAHYAPALVAQAAKPLLSAPMAVVANVPALFAQIDAPATEPASTASPWYLNPALIGFVIAAIPTLIALWQNKEKTKAQKINDTLIIGIEAAAKIPQVVQYEKAIKARIQAQAKAAGVEPLLEVLVRDLTKPKQT